MSESECKQKVTDDQTGYCYSLSTSRCYGTNTARIMHAVSSNFGGAKCFHRILDGCCTNQPNIPFVATGSSIEGEDGIKRFCEREHLVPEHSKSNIIYKHICDHSMNIEWQP